MPEFIPPFVATIVTETLKERAMSDIDWNDNAKAAVRAYNDWMIREYECGPIDEFMKTIATRPTEPRKTVEDAVEAHPEGWNSIPQCGGDLVDEELVLWDIENSCFHQGCIGFDEGYFSQVCTREEFEACVATKSEPKWTHVSEAGNKCRYLMDTVHGELYQNEHGSRFIPGFDGHNSVKPIKPTITKTEAEKRLGMTIID